MDWTKLYQNTLLSQFPKIINDNFQSFKDYMDVFYDETGRVIIKPVNTTGRVKATTGEFINVLVDNLTVKKEFTNMYENITTSDLDFVTVYNGPDTSTRIATDVSLWPYENPYYRWYDATKPYYKLSNANPVAFQNDELGKIVRLIFDPSASGVSNFQILLDQDTNAMFEVNIQDSSALYLELITVKYDVSWGPTWVPYKFGRLDASFAGGSGGSVGPGTPNYIPRFYTTSTVGDSSIYMSGSTLITKDISANNIAINNSLKDVSGNQLIIFNNSLQLNSTTSGKDVSIYGNTKFYGIVNNDASLYVKGVEATIFRPTVAADVKMPEDVGGLVADTSAAALNGLNYNQLLTDLLFPTAYPSFTSPSLTSFTKSALTYVEVGDIINIIFTSTFNRGTITPAYGTSGYRSGLPNSYIYTGTGLAGTKLSTSTTDSSTLYDYTVLIGNQSWTSKVAYDQGEQPYDNKGNVYSTPWDASISNIRTIIIEGVYPIYATLDPDITTLASIGLYSMSSAYIEDIHVATETTINRAMIDIPDAWIGAPTNNPLTAMQQWDDNSSSWKAISLSEWTTSAVTHEIQGLDVDYTRYTHSGGSEYGDRLIKLIF